MNAVFFDSFTIDEEPKAGFIEGMRHASRNLIGATRDQILTAIVAEFGQDFDLAASGKSQSQMNVDGGEIVGNLRKIPSVGEGGHPLPFRNAAASGGVNPHDIDCSPFNPVAEFPSSR